MPIERSLGAALCLKLSWLFLSANERDRQRKIPRKPSTKRNHTELRCIAVIRYLTRRGGAKRITGIIYAWYPE